MSKGVGALVVLLGSCFLFCALRPIELDAPLPREQEVWRHIPGEISLYVREDLHDEALLFVVDNQNKEAPLILSLDGPKNREEISAFLRQCKGAIDHRGGHSRMAMVAVGRSLFEQVQQWIAENVAKSSEKTLNLSNFLFGAPNFQVITDSHVVDPRLEVTYEFSLPTMRTSRDLRKMWNIALIQQMAGHRLKMEGVECEEEKKFSSFLLPHKTVAYRFTPPRESDGFSHFLRGLQEIRHIGFTVQELGDAKKFFFEKIRQLQQEQFRATAPRVAAFHAEGFLRNLGLLSYGYFLESAPILIESITPVDIAIALQECFLSNQRHITLTTPPFLGAKLETLVRNEIDQSEHLTGDRGADFSATGMEAPNSYFYQLPLHESEKEIIYKIVDTMARDNVIKLGLKRKSMEKKGRRIRQVHPLRFLGYVFSDPHLHQCMREISRSSFKWNGFIDGYKERIREENAQGNLLRYVHEFAELVHRDENEITRIIHNHDWEGLVRYLL